MIDVIPSQTETTHKHFDTGIEVIDGEKFEYIAVYSKKDGEVFLSDLWVRNNDTELPADPETVAVCGRICLARAEEVYEEPVKHVPAPKTRRARLIESLINRVKV